MAGFMTHIHRTGSGWGREFYIFFWGAPEKRAGLFATIFYRNSAFTWAITHPVRHLLFTDDPSVSGKRIFATIPGTGIY